MTLFVSRLVCFSPLITRTDSVVKPLPTNMLLCCSHTETIMLCACNQLILANNANSNNGAIHRAYRLGSWIGVNSSVASFSAPNSKFWGKQKVPAVALEGKFRCVFLRLAGLFHTLLPQAFTDRWTAHTVKQADQWKNHSQLVLFNHTELSPDPNQGPRLLRIHMWARVDRLESQPLLSRLRTAAGRHFVVHWWFYEGGDGAERRSEMPTFVRLHPNFLSLILQRLNSFAFCLIVCLHHEWCDNVCHVQEAQQLVPVLSLKCFSRVYLWLYLSTTFTQTQPPASTQLGSNGLSIITLWLPWLVKAVCNHFLGAQYFVSLKPEGYWEEKKTSVIYSILKTYRWLRWRRVWTGTWKGAGSSVGSRNQNMITFKIRPIRPVVMIQYLVLGSPSEGTHTVWNRLYLFGRIATFWFWQTKNLICCDQRHVKSWWWASWWLPYTQQDRPGQAVILDQYFQDVRTVRVSFTSQDKTSAPSLLLLEVFSSHPDWTNIIELTSGQMTPCYWRERHKLGLQITQNSTITDTQSFRLVRRCSAALTLDGSSWLEAHKPQPSFPQVENQNL